MDGLTINSDEDAFIVFFDIESEGTVSSVCANEIVLKIKNNKITFIPLFIITNIIQKLNLS